MISNIEYMNFVNYIKDNCIWEISPFPESRYLLLDPTNYVFQYKSKSKNVCTGSNNHMIFRNSNNIPERFLNMINRFRNLGK